MSVSVLLDARFQVFFALVLEAQCRGWSYPIGIFWVAQPVEMLSRRAVKCFVKQRITVSSPVWGSRTVEEAKLLAAHWPPLVVLSDSDLV